MRRLHVAVSLSIAGLCLTCVSLAVYASDSFGLVEKAVAVADLSYPEAGMVPAARTVLRGSTDAKTKARAAELLERIDMTTVMGDYRCAGDKPLYAQVIAYDRGQYVAKVFAGPGRASPVAGTLTRTGNRDKIELSGKINDRTVTAVVSGGKMTLMGSELTKVLLTSPTLSTRPPKGAIVLFDGKNLDAWKGVRGGPARWTLVGGGAMQVAPRTRGIISKQQFGDHRVHVEFRTPLMPTARGQGRGNSGVYLQGRYEVQVLDSYGLVGRSNECGGIYKVAAPKVNMCYPPTVWQTYDIEFRAPRFKDGTMTDPPRMTVYHNGVKIHDKQALRRTTAAPASGNTPVGGLFLQDHGNPVQYRNIWVVETKPKPNGQ